MKILNPFILLTYFLLFHFQPIEIEIKNTQPKSIEIPEEYEKISNQNPKFIKGILIKILEKEINEAGFFDRYFADKALDKVSKKLAICYNDIVNIQEDPLKSLSLTNEIIDNTQVYVEIIIAYLNDLKNKSLEEYNQIKNIYCTDFFEQLFNNHNWINKASSDELEKIHELESQIEEIENIQKVLNKTVTLFKIVDWITHSYSPLAWLVRKIIF